MFLLLEIQRVAGTVAPQRCCSEYGDGTLSGAECVRVTGEIRIYSSTILKLGPENTVGRR
jgi:hypothetical protein